MGRRRQTSPIEDWFDLVAMLPWWLGLLLAAASYVLLHGVAEGGSEGAVRTGADVAAKLWQTLAWVGQYVVPAVCVAGAAASGISRLKTHKAPAVSVAAGQADRKLSFNGSEQSVLLAVVMLAGGAVLLILPRLSDAEMVQDLIDPLRPLGWTMFVVGIGMSLVMLWALAFADKGEGQQGGQAVVDPAEAARPLQTAILDGDSDMAAQWHLSRLEQVEKTAPPAALASARDVERMLDLIEWRRFEAVVARCFQLQGFATGSQAHGADGGVDIRLYREDNPDELVGVVYLEP